MYTSMKKSAQLRWLARYIIGFPSDDAIRWVPAIFTRVCMKCSMNLLLSSAETIAAQGVIPLRVSAVPLRLKRE